MKQKINLRIDFSVLRKEIKGKLLTDRLHSILYSTDASAYKENPLAVLIAENSNDIKQAIHFCLKNGISLIPRTAGTSIAGQVVGGGLIVDLSKNFNKILEVNVNEKWARVEPGVVLDELNLYLKEYGLFFGPETSTSNRCMIGGMVGNNSCGAHSLIYGSTRDHTLEIKAFLGDGTEVVFKELSEKEFYDKCKLNTLEGDIYRSVNEILSDKETRMEIEREYPDEDLERRNTGYAIDLLSRMKPFSKEGNNFNFCSLLCGSEGTLAFITEVKLNLVPLPPKEKGLLAIHHKSIDEALVANIVVLEHKPVAIELIDKFLLDCTKESLEHSKNRFFLQGDPGALLCVEFTGDSKEEIERKSHGLIGALIEKGFGYHFPLLFGNDISKVWALRKAGLGLLSNIPGDAKPQPVIEDTAVSPYKLPDYIRDFNDVLAQNKLECVYYAHIATGELHLRPVLNLKEKDGVRKFRLISEEIARLVKKYNGSLSGEHGDGRLRGEFIEYMVGEKNYQVLKKLKQIWDPQGVFNIGKIIDTPPMDTNLRFIPGFATPEIETVFDFSSTLGMVRMAEKCNGSADCRKTEIIGGVMCPSYQATRDERNTTRARANMLREVINNNPKNNKFDDKELMDVLDLCLSCKGCKSECPSGVDMAKLKSEALYQYYKNKLRPLRSVIIASYSKIQAIACLLPQLYNILIKARLVSSFAKYLIGFAQQRSLPNANKVTWAKWLKKNIGQLNQSNEKSDKKIMLFIDEFTNYNELDLGIATVRLLSKLGYLIVLSDFKESGRAKISKGFLRSSQKIAEHQVLKYSETINENLPLVGIEPSAILCFRDEYPDLLRGELKGKSEELAKSVFTIEEFLYKEFLNGYIQQSVFHDLKRTIKYHGHCQQKILIGTIPAKSILSIPENYQVEEIKSGCCGMAGSFGYEKEHFELSRKIGEMILFPAIRKSDSEEIISASGTSCRHHIKDGTGRIAKHPVEILYEALKF
jgi:FAD/FMN-containing dehydrogenase/Fe-S oxidoreductase